jgi:hypothetical protein
MSRTWRFVLLAYALKTALVAAAWLAFPDLPARAAAEARQAWDRVRAGQR